MGAISPADQRAQEVANWLSFRFSERAWWADRELAMAAQQCGISLGTWWHSPAVKALGIRGKLVRQPWADGPSMWWTTEPKTDQQL
jgi:hypothetical protein